MTTTCPPLHPKTSPVLQLSPRPPPKLVLHLASLCCTLRACVAPSELQLSRPSLPPCSQATPAAAPSVTCTLCTSYWEGVPAWLQQLQDTSCCDGKANTAILPAKTLTAVLSTAVMLPPVQQLQDTSCCGGKANTAVPSQQPFDRRVHVAPRRLQRGDVGLAVKEAHVLQLLQLRRVRGLRIRNRRGGGKPSQPSQPSHPA